MNTEQEFLALQQRNKRVEADKAWETSWTRRTVIMVMTYVCALAWLFVISEPKLFLKSFVPVIGYAISTFSLPFVKRQWLKHLL